MVNNILFSLSSDNEINSRDIVVLLVKMFPIHFSAGRKPKKIKYIPASVVIITGEEIKKYGYKNSPKCILVLQDRRLHLVGLTNFGVKDFFPRTLVMML